MNVDHRCLDKHPTCKLDINYHWECYECKKFTCHIDGVYVYGSDGDDWDVFRVCDGCRTMNTRGELEGSDVDDKWLYRPNQA